MKHTWGRLPLRYTEPKEILRELPLGDGERLIVVGDGSNGSYEWAIEKGLHVERFSDVGYGIADVALRDGLTAIYGPSTSYAAPADAFASTIPCARCGGKCVEFTVPNDVWNTVVRRGGKESDDEYLCEACYRIAVERFVRSASGLIVTDTEVDALALHLCESENEHPEGTQNRVLNDGVHSITFKEIAKRRVRVIVNQLAVLRRTDSRAESGK